jgi:hypothetical protein
MCLSIYLDPHLIILQREFDDTYLILTNILRKPLFQDVKNLWIKQSIIFYTLEENKTVTILNF